MKGRCPWARTEIEARYHDEEWGVPVTDGRKTFEFLVLEGAQAGLSWLTILKKREAYRRAFHGFDPERVARYGKRDVARLLADAGIVRNRLKIESAISNAKAFLAVEEERDGRGGLAGLLWEMAGGAPVQNRWRSLAQIPPRTPLSDAISRELKRRGFRFVGSTIVYAHLQATGLANDHLVTCPRHAACAALGRRLRRGHV